MNDTELLEYAAKAAGIDERRLPDAWPNRFDDDQWNPLIDDTDALRLAVKLGFIIDTHGLHIRVSLPFGDYLALETHDNDPYAATRRAIVRAAAAIGKTK